jgi:hypothetical protein
MHSLSDVNSGPWLKLMCVMMADKFLGTVGCKHLMDIIVLYEITLVQTDVLVIPKVLMGANNWN